MTKFGRTYKLAVYEIKTDANPSPSLQPVVTVDYPITLDMNISRMNLSGANTGTLTMRNLGPDKRRQLYKAPPPALITHKVILRAGYVGDPFLPIVFIGQIIAGRSYREGPDWVTQLTAFDSILGIQNGLANFSFPARQYDFTSIMDKLIQAIPLVNLGFISDAVTIDNSKGYSYSGPAWAAIEDLARQNGMSAYVDNEKVYVVPANTFTQVHPQANVTFTVSAATGLLNTPTMYGGWMSLDMIFEPRAAVGDVVTVESTEKIYNGNWQISGFTHRGIISPVRAGQLITNLALLPCNVLQLAAP